MKKMQDYKVFAVRKYLEEQNSAIEQDEEFMMHFFHQTYTKFGGSKKLMLELGGGPTIYQIISARNHVRKIVFTDLLQEDLNEVIWWFNKEKKAFNWDHYFKTASILEGKKPTKEHIEQMKKELRAVPIEFVIFDIYSKKLPPNMAKGLFDIVSINFFPEAVATNPESFNKLMKIILSFVKQDGLFIMHALKNRTTYVNDGKIWNVYPLDEKIIRKSLEKNGFTEIEIYTTDVVRTTGPNTIMSIRAKKK
jgi:hypothetical protein